MGSAPILPWGKCFGIFSVKKLFLLQIITFEIGSAICGAAPNMTTLIIGRVIAGLGGSGMYSGSLSYIAMMTTKKERSAYVAGVSAVWGLGSVLGPVVCHVSMRPLPRPTLTHAISRACARLSPFSLLTRRCNTHRSVVALLRAMRPGDGHSISTW